MLDVPVDASDVAPSRVRVGRCRRGLAEWSLRRRPPGCGSAARMPGWCSRRHRHRGRDTGRRTAARAGCLRSVDRSRAQRCRSKGRSARRAGRARRRPARRRARGPRPRAARRDPAQLLAGAGAPLRVRTAARDQGPAAMRCPKCQYISFDERRSLPQLRLRLLADRRHRDAARSADSDGDEAVGPMADLRLDERRSRVRQAVARPTPSTPPPTAPAGRARFASSFDLPLFTTARR